MGKLVLEFQLGDGSWVAADSVPPQSVRRYELGKLPQCNPRGATSADSTCSRDPLRGTPEPLVNRKSVWHPGGGRPVPSHCRRHAHVLLGVPHTGRHVRLVYCPTLAFAAMGRVRFCMWHRPVFGKPAVPAAGCCCGRLAQLAGATLGLGQTALPRPYVPGRKLSQL